jgi:hypothetical protein
MRAVHSECRFFSVFLIHSHSVAAFYRCVSPSAKRGSVLGAAMFRDAPTQKEKGRLLAEAAFVFRAAGQLTS